jgi:acyl carrier protein
MEAATEVLTFQGFWIHAGDVIGVDPGAVDPSTHLADLELDSLQMVELIVFVEELGCEVPEDLVPALVTAGDVYAHYVTRITAEHSGGE